MIFIGANTTPASLPVTLTNGTTADADQVMADFNALKNYVNAYSNAIHATTGSASTQVLTYVATPLTLIAGTAFLFTIGAGLTNVGPTTLTVNGTGAKNLTINGIALSGGELTPGMVVFAVYDGTQYQIVGLSGSGGALAPDGNVLINPSMEIDQEHEGASVSVPSGTYTYVLDGWQIAFASAATVTAQRSSNAPPGFGDSLVTSVATGAAVGASNCLSVVQQIEANSITNWAVGTSSARNLILSFLVQSTIGNYTMCGSLQNDVKNRSYPFDVHITDANVWEQKSVSIPLDTAGTWITTGGAVGAILNLSAAVGVTLQSPANAWVTGNFLGTSACTNTLLTTNGANIYVTGVSLYVGSVPVSFRRRPFMEELALCQRYYEKSYNYGVALGTSVTAGDNSVYFSGPSGGPIMGTAAFKVTKRVVPTMTIYDSGSGSNKLTYFDTIWNANGAITSVTPYEMGVNVRADILSSVAINYDFVADARM